MHISTIERQLEPFDSHAYDLVTPTPAQLAGYSLSSLDRDSGSLFVAYHHLDGKGPKGTLIELCGRQDTVAVLDAGCGTGSQLVNLMVQLAITEGIDPKRILADGVSDHDFSRFSRDRITRVALGAGLANYAVMDLAQDALPSGAYDMSYSYEVLMHNEEPEPIIENVWQALAPGGVSYFNTDGRQVGRVGAFVERYNRDGGEVLYGEMKSPASLWLPLHLRGETRHAFKVTKPGGAAAVQG
jgi:SAM-dependent methyltransferase